MTCPRCSAEFDPDIAECPECGVQLARKVSGVMKTSAVMIATGDERGFYRSVQDVPEPLRRQLIEITNSANSGTIVIADRAGKEQITQRLARRESTREHVAPREAPAPPEPKRRILGLSWIVWAGFLLVLVAAGIITAMFVIHW
jgi:hypothetical protein